MRSKTSPKLHLPNFFTSKFVLKNRTVKSGFGKKVALQVFINRTKHEKTLPIVVDPKSWDKNSESVKGNDQYAIEVNILIEQIKSKLHTIIARHYFEQKPVTWEKLIDELNDMGSSDDFLLFMSKKIDEKENNGDLSEKTAATHRVILRRCERYRITWPFHIITDEFMNEFSRFLYSELKSKEKKSGIPLKNGGMNTVNITLKITKTYLFQAKNVFDFNMPKFKIRWADTTREFLSKDELKSLINSYTEFKYSLSPLKSNALEMFLFACATGLRISDVKQMRSEYVSNDIIVIKPHKRRKDHQIINVPLTPLARFIIGEKEGKIFKNHSEQKINEALKSIAADHNIQKNISMVVGRHTFATLFLQNNGKIKALQDILGHKSLRTTQNYLHVDNQFLKNEMKLMDDLLKP